MRVRSYRPSAPGRRLVDGSRGQSRIASLLGSWAIAGGTPNMQRIRIVSEYLGRRLSQRASTGDEQPGLAVHRWTPHSANPPHTCKRLQRRAATHRGSARSNERDAPETQSDDDASVSIEGEDGVDEAVHDLRLLGSPGPLVDRYRIF